MVPGAIDVEAITPFRILPLPLLQLTDVSYCNCKICNAFNIFTRGGSAFSAYPVITSCKTRYITYRELHR